MLLFECARGENKRSCWDLSRAVGTKEGKVGETLIIYVIVGNFSRSHPARQQASAGAAGRGCDEEQGAAAAAALISASA